MIAMNNHRMFAYITILQIAPTLKKEKYGHTELGNGVSNFGKK